MSSSRRALLCLGLLLLLPAGMQAGFAAESEIGTLHLWDMETGKELPGFAGGDFNVHAVALSPDGKTLATTLEGGGLLEGPVIMLWDLKERKPLTALKGYTRPIDALAFSPDGRRLASGSADGSVRLWDVAGGKEIMRLAVEPGPVNSVAFSPDGRWLVSAGVAIHIWDAASGQERSKLSTPTGWVTSLAFSPDGKILAAGSTDQSITLLRAAEVGGQPGLRYLYAGNLPGHTGWVTSVAFSPSGQTLASGGADSTVRLWDVASGKQLRMFAAPTPVTAVAFLSQGKSLAAGGGHQVQLWETTTGKPLRSSLPAGDGFVSSLAVTPDGKVLIAGGDLQPTEYSTLHVLAIGIDEYSHIAQGLAFQYCKVDALALAQAMEERGKGVFARIDTRTLLEKGATRQSIQEAFENLILQSKPGDTVFIYIAGAGRQNPEAADYELFASDSSLGSEGGPASNAISGQLLKSWLEKIPAKNRVIVFDTGYLESAIHSLTGNQSAAAQRAAELSHRSLAILGAGGAEPELSDLKHGAFTYALLQGLAGEADTSPRDGQITARELEAYLYDKLLAMSNEKGHQMRALSYLQGPNFPLAFLDKVPPPQSARTRGTAAEEGEAGQPAPVPAKPARKDYALLFATNQYDNVSSLVNPVPDARAIAQELHDSYGFETKVIENPTVDTIMSTLREYATMKYGDGDQLLIFFAGHGSYDEVFKRGYILGRDSKADDTTGRTYLSHDELRGVVDGLPAKHILLVLDVCFGGTFDRRIGQGGARGDDQYANLKLAEYLKRKQALPTRKFITSGGKVYVPDGVPGHHSPFASHLLAELRTYGGKQGYLTFNQVLAGIQATNPEPVWGTWPSDESGSDFVFVSKSAAEEKDQN